MGLAMVTKSQYLPLGMGTIVLVALLDRFYYRQQALTSLVTVAIAAAVCVAAWHGWQIWYYGIDLYRENADKLVLLARSTMGLNLRSTVDAFRFLLGSGSGHYYYFWGWAALLYAGALAIRRNREGIALAFLLTFTILWLAYFTFWIIPWFRYFLPAGVLTAFFVAKLFVDLAASLTPPAAFLGREFAVSAIDMAPGATGEVGRWGAAAAVLAMTLFLGYDLQKTVRDDVLDSTGNSREALTSPPQFGAPREIARYLDQHIEQRMIIETWERELGILTNHTYHYPDQVLLADVHARVYRGRDRDYRLGEAYLKQIKPQYLVIGWYARFYNVYDVESIARLGTEVATFGAGEWRYDVYKMERP
jgi:hypothetical protein